MIDRHACGKSNSSLLDNLLQIERIPKGRKAGVPLS